MKKSEGALLGSDGIRLFYRRWEVPAPRAVCLLVHGLGEHGGRYEGVAKALTDHGFSAWANDHRGHGRSEGPRGDCRSLADFTVDLHRIIEQIRGEEPAAPLVLIGHSLGGLIALAYASEHPGSIQAVAVSSPALKLAQEPPKAKWLIAQGLSRILPQTPIPNEIDPHRLCRDTQVVEAYQTDPLVHRVMTARCAVALRHAMEESPALAKRLRIPCLILQAGSDFICDPKGADLFASEVTGAPVTFRRYEGMYHELFNEPERAEVLEELCRWLNEVARR